MQEVFAWKCISKPSIFTRTALCWLEKIGWSYRKLKNGMYLDRHEREDVVEYRQGFVECWMRYKWRFHQWDHNETELSCPNGFPVHGVIRCFCLILVTYDESMFFQNDEGNTGWSHATSKTKPKAKGNGQSLMVSDFLTPDWGLLHDGKKWVLSSSLHLVHYLIYSIYLTFSQSPRKPESSLRLVTPRQILWCEQPHETSQ